jgi:hypothetical protein
LNLVALDKVAAHGEPRDVADAALRAFQSRAILRAYSSLRTG